MYRVRATGEVKTQGEIRKDNPNTSFPAVWDESVCEFIGIDPVFESPTPSYTEYQGIRQDGIENVNGKWFKKYVVYDFDEEAIAAIDEQKVKANKDKAAKLLSDSDFYDLPNTANQIVNIADIIAYRALLRAIALNPTKDAVFPEKPETIWS
jgi:hypothetical protein